MWRRLALALAALPALAGCASEAALGRPWVHKVDVRPDAAVQQKLAVDPGQLRAKLLVQPTSWMPLSSRRYLDPFMLRGDRERVEAFYRAEGYYGARATIEAEPSADDAVDVTITVAEGQPTRLIGVTARGLEALGQEAPRIPHLKIGEVMRYADYVAAKQGLKERLQARGYAWAEVKGELRIDAAARTAQVHFEVAPGPKVRFGKVEARGVTGLDAAAVVRRAGVVEGAPFDPAVLDTAEDRLSDLGVYASIDFEYVQRPGAPDVADVIVVLRQALPRELRIGVGFGIEPQRTEVHVPALFHWRNFLGGARLLQLRVEPAYVALPAFWSLEQHGPAGTIEAQLVQPLWSETQLRVTAGLDLGVEYGYQFWGPRGQLALSHTLWHDRSGPSLFHERLRVTASYNWQFLDVFNTDEGILRDPQRAGPLYGYEDPYRLGWFQEELLLDLRDDPQNPRLGIYAAVTLEEGGSYALGAFAYEKLLPEVRAYFSLGSRVVVAGRAQFGQIFTHGGASPITRRFYLGGPSSHRGFSYNRLAPQVPSGRAGVSPLPIGGDQMLLFSAELRVDVVQLGGQWLVATVFADAGDVASPSCAGVCDLPAGSSRPYAEVDPSRLHYAVGGGLRLRTELGTLRFDVGVRLNRFEAPEPDPGQRVAFHLSLGEAF